MINTLHLGLSYACNMRCKHCFVDKKSDKLNLEDYMKIIDTLYDEGLIMIFYTFGEPLLSPLFSKVTNYAHTKNLFQTLMTNGYLLDETKIKLLKANKINRVYISLDSIDEREHNLNRGVNDAYQKAIQAIKLLKNNNINTGLAITIRQENTKHIKKILELAEELNVNNVSFLRERNNTKLINITDNLYFETFRNIVLNKEQYSFNVLFHDPELIQVAKELYEEKKIDINTYEKYVDMNSCHVTTNISIAPNGDVSRCNIFGNVVGNMKEEDIQEIINRGCEREHFICCTKLCQ